MLASKPTPMSSATSTMARIKIYVRYGESSWRFRSAFFRLMSRSILKALSLGDNIFDLSPETSETIRRIKESIQDKTKIPPDRQRLTLGGIPPLTDDSKP